MIRLIVYGTKKEIVCSKNILHYIYKKSYSSIVKENIPEYFRHLYGEKRLEVSFEIGDKFLDLKHFQCSKLLKASIKMEVVHCDTITVFSKPRCSTYFKVLRKKRVIRQDSLPVLEPREFLDTEIDCSNRMDDLSYYDDLEFWELQRQR